jgi:DNA-directed RNA polymerase subunit delta
MTEDLKARVSYLRGFTEGLDLGEESSEQKILHRVIDLLEDMTDEIEQLRVDYEELFEYTEAIDDDLTELEEDFYEDEDDDDDYDYDDFEDGFSIECPNCREIVVVDDNLLDQETAIEVTCPGCGEVVLVDDEDWDEDLDELSTEEDAKD